MMIYSIRYTELVIVKTMSEIIDGLYIGSIAEASNQEWLEENKITHILNMAKELPEFYPGKYSYKKVPMEDDVSCRIGKSFKEIISFIKSGHEKGRVLVHCMMGVSRSATAVMVYLMETRRISMKAAKQMVKSKRFVEPNHGFLTQLANYEMNMFKQNFDRASDSPTKQKRDILLYTARTPGLFNTHRKSQPPILSSDTCIPGVSIYGREKPKKHLRISETGKGENLKMTSEKSLRVFKRTGSLSNNVTPLNRSTTGAEQIISNSMKSFELQVNPEKVRPKPMNSPIHVNSANLLLSISLKLLTNKEIRHHTAASSPKKPSQDKTRHKVGNLTSSPSKSEAKLFGSVSKKNDPSKNRSSISRNSANYYDELIKKMQHKIKKKSEVDETKTENETNETEGESHKNPVSYTEEENRAESNLLIKPGLGQRSKFTSNNWKEFKKSMKETPTAQVSRKKGQGVRSQFGLGNKNSTISSVISNYTKPDKLLRKNAKATTTVQSNNKDIQDNRVENKPTFPKSPCLTKPSSNIPKASLTEKKVSKCPNFLSSHDVKLSDPKVTSSKHPGTISTGAKASPSKMEASSKPRYAK